MTDPYRTNAAPKQDAQPCDDAGALLDLLETLPASRWTNTGGPNLLLDGPRDSMIVLDSWGNISVGERNISLRWRQRRRARKLHKRVMAERRSHEERARIAKAMRRLVGAE